MKTDRSHLLFHSDDEFEAYVAFERQRRKRSDMRPPGARLSTVCPIQMVQAVHDETARVPIDPGDAARGHEMESRFRATLLFGVPHEYQPLIEWSHGLSAWDARLEDGTTVELKSTVGRLNLHHDYRCTTQRRMVAAGMGPGDAVDVFVVSPSNYQWAGPFSVFVDVDTFDRYALELARVGSALDYFEPDKSPEKSGTWRDGAWWREQFELLCGCGGCTDHTSLDANGALESLAFRWELAMDAVEDAARTLGGKPSWDWREGGIRARLIEALDRQAEPHRAGARESGSAIRIETYGTNRGIKASWSPKSERWLIKRKPAEKVEEAA